MGNKGSAEKEAPPPKEEIKQPALKEDIKKVEKEFAAKEAAQAKQREELLGGGTIDLRDASKDAGGGLQHQEKSAIEIETEKLRQKATADLTSAVDNSIDTLVMTHDQIQQSKDDTKRLHRINEKLTEAEAHLKELEKGFFNISSSGQKVTLPDKGELDDEFPIQMWKNWMTRYHPYTLRFTGGCVMRINGVQELKDTAAYGQIKLCKVLSKGNATDQYIEFHFDSKLGVPDNKWEICSTDRAALVKMLAQRKYNALGEDLQVEWEAGVTKFDIHVIKKEDAVRDKFSYNTNPKGTTTGAKKADAWGLNDQNHEAFLDNTSALLDTLMDVSKAQSEAFGEHMDVLKDQQEVMGGAKQRLDIVNKRTHDVEKNI